MEYIASDLSSPPMKEKDLGKKLISIQWLENVYIRAWRSDELDK
jgi:hypothetical protein